MTREIENRLERALEDIANRSVPGGRAVPPFPLSSQRPAGHRARWVPPLLAAAAVVGLIIATTLVARGVNADRGHPAVGHPASTFHLPGPVIAVTPTPHSRASASAKPSPSRQVISSAQHTSAPSTSSAPAQVRQPHAAIANGVRVTIPGAWSVSPGPRSADGGVTSCLQAPGGICALYVIGGSQSTALRFDQPADSSSGCAWPTLTYYGHRTLAGRVMEYRRFSGPCGTAEQWGLAATPPTFFWHKVGVEDGQVSQVLSSLTLPSQISPLPLIDVGYLNSVTKQADGYHVVFTRAIRTPDLQQVVARDAGTYSFVVQKSVGTSGFWCSSWKIPGYTPPQTCTIDDLATQSAKGPHPSDGSLPIDAVLVIQWSSGGVPSTLQDTASFPGA